MEEAKIEEMLIRLPCGHIKEIEYPTTSGDLMVRCDGMTFGTNKFGDKKKIYGECDKIYVFDLNLVFLKEGNE